MPSHETTQDATLYADIAVLRQKAESTSSDVAELKQLVGKLVLIEERQATARDSIERLGDRVSFCETEILIWKTIRYILVFCLLLVGTVMTVVATGLGSSLWNAILMGATP